MASNNRTSISLDKSETDKEISEIIPTPIRRRVSLRIRKRPEKYGETSSKRMIREEIMSSDNDDESDTEISPSLKLTALFGSDDVKWQDISKFKSRHTKHDLHKKVKAAISKSPSPLDVAMRTRRKSVSSASQMKRICEATPKHVNEIMKKRIISQDESDSDDNDFSGSSSDFVPDETDNESYQSISSSEEKEESPTKPVKLRISKHKDNKTSSKESEYIVTPDNYFMMNSTRKITTSNRILLARFKNLSINENVSDDFHISDEHKNKIKELSKSYNHLFNQWLYILSENFNIILYGIGSKRSILHQFQTEKLQDFSCIVINGFFPSVTIKDILETIVKDLLQNSTVPSNTGDVVNLIHSQLSENGMELFIIIHNIDGTALRNAKTQAILASISQIRNVHFIATIDHINAPLLWDHSKLSKFNFTWWDVTTFLPYTQETSYENSITTDQSGDLQMSSLRSVYQSLTTNAKEILKIIIEYHLENQKQHNYQGLPFKDLYTKAREKFLVSSDTALRAQLTDVLEHKLVIMKRTFNKTENLIIPINNALLQQFLEETNVY